MESYSDEGRGRDRIRLSFEFFPPKSDQMAATLEATAARLSRYAPDFVSVTYGAGGSSQERSIGAVRRISEAGLPTAAHLTCAGASRDELSGVIREFFAMGISRFVALRGDPAGGSSIPYAPHPEGYRDTAELVAALKRAGAAEVSVSAYPEKHPQSADWQADLDALKRKVDAGASRAITQFFFDNDLYEAFVERVRRAGINVPVVPGILPIQRFSAAADFAARCGATVPGWLHEAFAGIEPDTDAHREMAAEKAAEQIADLQRRGVAEFHIYTLNRSELTEAVLARLGILPREHQAAA